VTKIKELVPADESLYVFTSGTSRIDKEAFASVSGRGNGQRLITKEGGEYVTATDMKDVYGWVCTKTLYECTSAVNMNEVEKRVHKLMWADRRSIWIRNGAGGVHLDNDGKVLKFSLSIIHGPRKGLNFAAKHPRTLVT